MLEKIIETYLIPADDYIYDFADLTGLVDKKFGPRLRLVSILLRTSVIFNQIP